MMTAEQVDRAQEVLKECGLDWWARTSGGHDAFSAHLTEVMENFAGEYVRRFGGRMSSFAVFELYPRKKSKVRAFLQAVVSSATPKMLVMVWRIQEGMNIEAIEMNYSLSKESFSLTVTLASPYVNGAPETYTSNNIDDAALVRHFGIMKMGDAPIVDGFYALHMT